MSKTVGELRKRCKALGVGMKIKTYSFGPSVTFYVGGIATNSVLPLGFYSQHASTFEQLQQLQREFHGVTYKGNKLYGLLA